MGEKLCRMLTGKNRKEQALIVILAGVLCLLIVWPVPGRSSDEPDGSADGTKTVPEGQAAGETKDLEAYVKNQEERLAKLLSAIEGAGEVRVMIRAAATGEYVIEKDVTSQNSSVEETDSQGGSRRSSEGSHSESTVYAQDENGQDVPYVIRKTEPEIEGVVVCCEGGGEERVADEISEAVQALYDVPAHKIKVVKMKQDNGQ